MLKSFSLFLIVLLLLAGGIGAYVLFQDLEGPSIALSPETGGRLSPAQELTATLHDAAGINSVVVTLKRSTQSMVILRQNFTSTQPDRVVTFNLKDSGLPEGAFDLEVKAYDASMAAFGKGNSTTKSWPMTLDSQSPRISVKTLPPGIRRGGSALIVYNVSEEVRATGVYVGKLFFPGYRQPNGSYVCLFPFPYTETSTTYSPEIMAQDIAGNVTSSGLLVNAQGRVFREDIMKIDDKFLNFKADELTRIYPEGTTVLDKYIYVNTKTRHDNDAVFMELGRKSADKFLWEGKFVRLPRSAVKANFGDFRTYKYGDLKIDEQTHSGLDLASVAQAEVPAANHGIVLYADYLGIYGNIVVIDHGLGLMTIYSHLSSFTVKPGDEVKTNQGIGHTGVTGLAGGDHVHFGFLVGGIPVQPLEWLDDNWVHNNITSRLANAK